MAAYLADDEGPMRGLEFLGMAEAAETSHLEILGGLALAAGDDEVIALVEWALPLQEAHATVRDAGIVLAALVRRRASPGPGLAGQPVDPGRDLALELTKGVYSAGPLRRGGPYDRARAAARRSGIAWRCWPMPRR